MYKRLGQLGHTEDNEMTKKLSEQQLQAARLANWAAEEDPAAREKKAWEVLVMTNPEQLEFKPYERGTLEVDLLLGDSNPARRDAAVARLLDLVIQRSKKLWPDDAKRNAEAARLRKWLLAYDRDLRRARGE